MRVTPKDYRRMFEHLSAAMECYAVLDQRIPTDALLHVIMKALISTRDDLPYSFRRRIKGTEEYDLDHIPTNQLTTDQVFQMEHWATHDTPWPR